mmetsp:Transcript_21984/g.40941  ORF Transcript_21984/g.40941 Transcript_21984/m.40941 type:complete len:114 (-) Transcript_21984:46-387(-)
MAYRYGSLLDLKFSFAYDPVTRAGSRSRSDTTRAQIERNATSRHIIEMATSLDMQLYHYAKELAEQQLRANHAGLEALRAYRQRPHTPPKISAPQYSSNVSQAKLCSSFVYNS